MARPHAHQLDGKLHDDCEMCETIRSRQIGYKVEKQAEAALEQHRKRAERSKVGRDELRRKGARHEDDAPTG
jgi:hypothetical protein